jgi:flavin-dependent dehydrogenase
MAARPAPKIGSSGMYDAIVVGARAAGAATAMLLGRAGKRVLLVDRARYGADTLSTHALMRGGVMQLHRWGLLDRIREAGTPAIRRTHFHYGDDTVPVRVSDQHGVDALFAPRRTLLDPVLVDAAWDAGVDVVYGARVTGLRRAANGSVSGITADVDGTSDAIAEAAIVIGADGMGSTVAKLVGAPNSYRRTESGAYIYGYFPGLASDLYDWYFADGGAAGVMPTNDGLAAVFVGVPPEHFVTDRVMGLDALFRQLLHELAPPLALVLAGVAPAAGYRSFPGRPGHLRRAHGPGWALVGDAGYYKDPIVAHGITDALRDAELLARSLLTTGSAAAFESTRDMLSRPMLDVATSLAAFDADVNEVRLLHRALKAAMDEEIEVIAALDEAQFAAA